MKRFANCVARCLVVVLLACAFPLVASADGLAEIADGSSEQPIGADGGYIAGEIDDSGADDFAPGDSGADDSEAIDDSAEATEAPEAPAEPEEPEAPAEPAEPEAPADPPEPVSFKLDLMQRLYNLRTGEHFYTASLEERDSLIAAGWFYEGFGWVAPSTSETPVFRLYNQYSGDHHYTIDAQEREGLVQADWTDEGVGWYSDDAETVPVLRQYNPNAACGAHNFTVSQEENDGLANAGWNGEGTAWHAVMTGLPSAMSGFNRNHLQTIVDTTPGANWITLGHNTTLTDEQYADISRWLEADPTISFMAVNTRTGKCIAYRPDSRLFSASSAKAPFIAALCKYQAPGIEGYRDVLYDIITNSSNEAFAYLNTIYDKSYIYAFAREAGFEYDSPFTPAYAYYTPREIAKLWIDIHEFIYSDAPFAEMYRNLFGRGAIYKEGWMYPIAWCGQIYNLTGSEGDMVYGIMSRAENQSPLVWGLRDTLLSITS